MQGRRLDPAVEPSFWFYRDLLSGEELPAASTLYTCTFDGPATRLGRLFVVKSNPSETRRRY
jgi:hypothetical protein